MTKKQQVFAALKGEKVLDVNAYLTQKQTDIEEFKRKSNSADNNTPAAVKFFNERERQCLDQISMVEDMLKALHMADSIANYEITLVAKPIK